MNSCYRRIDTVKTIEPFVDEILKITIPELKRKAIFSILEAEKGIESFNTHPTLTHDDYRDFEYRDNRKREALRLTIIEELINKERLDSDDDITLNSGGARPKSEVQTQNILYYLIGPPAAGKSTIANRIADATGSYILDSDYAKRKLPEFAELSLGASVVHEESNSLIFGYKGRSLIDHCINKKYNMVVPKIGHNIDSVIQFFETMRMVNYDIYLVSVDLDRQKATQRAYNRYKDTKRYVPLSLIFDGYGNQPSLNYFKIKQRYRSLLSGFAQISTDVPKESAPQLLEEENMSFLKNLFGGILDADKDKN